MVFNISMIKTLLWQITTAPKRRKLAEGIYAEETDESPVKAYDAVSYLSQLWTYLMALAIAGVKARSDAPATPEVLGTDSTLYVEIPDLGISISDGVTMSYLEKGNS